MAGQGKRFADAGYPYPKPLLPVHGVPMYQIVMANMLLEDTAQVVIVTRREWEMAEHLRSLSARVGLPIHLVELDETTEGPAHTVEFAAPHLIAGVPVIVANSDQYVNAELSEFRSHLIDESCAGVILAMTDNDPKWSYVALDKHGNAALIREKQVISPYATVGVYGFSSPETMGDAFAEMRSGDDRTNGEFYVAPSYNYLIKAGKKVGVVDLGPIGTIMHGMGIPTDYENFLLNPISITAAQRVREICND
jgi:dTDP-glucose pyrophosphorylase